MEVANVEAESIATFPPEGEGVIDADLAIEITGTELEDDEIVVAPVDTAFYAVVSVPHNFDDSRLAPAIYVYGGVEYADGIHEIEPGWEFMSAQGWLDPSEGYFLIEIPFIGGEDYPARVVLAEHEERPTKVSEPTFEEILDVYISALEEREQALGFAPNAIHEPDHEVFWEIDCGFEPDDADHDCSCSVWENKVESALDKALPYYKGLDKFDPMAPDWEGSPTPNLRTTTRS